MIMTSFTKGILCASSAYFIWGLLPLYWKLLIAIEPMHILSIRILLSLTLVSVILLSKKNFKWLAALKDRKKRWLLILTAILICTNWGLYIWAVNSGNTLATSLGYYITPIFTICLGLLFFRERLRPLQWVAVSLALTGVTLITILSGKLPWVSLVLAFTFGIYGLLKKKVSLSALESLGAETILSVPVSILLLNFSFSGAAPVFTGFNGLAYLSGIPHYNWIILAFSGLFTMLPLYLFAQATKLLPLSAVGFCQFLSPTLTFFLSVFIFGEPFSRNQFYVFLIIWAAVIIYIISLRQQKH